MELCVICSQLSSSDLWILLTDQPSKAAGEQYDTSFFQHGLTEFCSESPDVCTSIETWPTPCHVSGQVD